MEQRSDPSFWPQGARAAVSLSFDDARPSQLDHGLPILDAHGVRASFYISPPAAETRGEAWRLAAIAGHELGNHSLTHPCSGNFQFVRSNGNPLEDYTLERMDAELAEANAWAERVLGVTPHTFAYPCGQTYVGRGATTQSYVPLVAQRFLAGRGYRQEMHNHPAHCDLAQLCGTEADGKSFAELRVCLDTALADGGWVVFCIHDVGDQPRLAIQTGVLDAICRHVSNPANRLWVDTVANVARHVASRQKG